MKSRTVQRSADSGQSTVEAAFLIPVMFVGLLMLLQPSILLYDRVVMQGAAVEGCRLLATRTSVVGDMQPSCEAFIRHRLSAVPPVSCFHVHEEECTWNMAFSGDETTQTVRVDLSTEARPLPLFDVTGTLLGLVNDRGNFDVAVSAEFQTQPDWVADVEIGRNPAEWIGAWLG